MEDGPMCRQPSDHWVHRDLAGWRLLLMRLTATALMLLIGVGLPAMFR
jgi:hypothetical protein